MARAHSNGISSRDQSARPVDDHREHRVEAADAVVVGSTPIIWGDRIFLNVAENGEPVSLGRRSRKGEPMWKRHLSDGDNRQA